MRQISIRQKRKNRHSHYKWQKKKKDEWLVAFYSTRKECLKIKKLMRGHRVQ